MKIFKVIPISLNRLILSNRNCRKLVIPRRLVLYGYNMQESLKTFGRYGRPPFSFHASGHCTGACHCKRLCLKKYYVANRQISQSIKVTLTMGPIFTPSLPAAAVKLQSYISGQEGQDTLYSIIYRCGYIPSANHAGILNGLPAKRPYLSIPTGSIEDLF